MKSFKQYLNEYFGVRDNSLNYSHPQGARVRLNRPGHPQHGQIGVVLRSQPQMSGVEFRNEKNMPTGGIEWHSNDTLKPERN